jgi:hypothetical protein
MFHYIEIMTTINKIREKSQLDDGKKVEVDDLKDYMMVTKKKVYRKGKKSSKK